MELASRQCKAFEGECQCQNSSVTNSSLRDLCDTHETKYIYLKDLYYKNYDKYIQLTHEEKLYFCKLSDFLTLQNLKNISEKSGQYMLMLHPEWIFEWDFEKNTGLTYRGKEINIHDIFCKFGKAFWWKCFCGYVCEESPKTRIRRVYPCKKCARRAKQTCDTKREKRRAARAKEEEQGILNAGNKGDVIEIYFETLLQSTGIFKSVVRMGHLGGSSDIEITLHDGSVRQLQVKKLSKTQSVSYGSSGMYKYVYNMLIVGADEEFKRFFIGFSQRFHQLKTPTTKNDNVYFSFFQGFYNNPYDEFCYVKDCPNERRDEKTFLNELVSCIPFSTSENDVNETNQKEDRSQTRFSLFCNQFDLIYKRNTSHASRIDGFLQTKNGRIYNVQMKYRAGIKSGSSNSYQISSQKNCGQGVHEPYHVNDNIDYFVVEIGGTPDIPDKYHNNFMIIPKETMRKEEIFASDISRGSHTFSVRPPNEYQKEDWTTPFWNKIPDEWK